MRRTEVKMEPHEMAETVCDLCERVIRTGPAPSTNGIFPMPIPPTMALSYWPSLKEGGKTYFADVCEGCVVTKVWPALEAMGVREVTAASAVSGEGKS